MQEDPVYHKMLEKSFIMSKYHQRNPKVPIPKVKKKKTMLHQAVTTGFLSTLIHLISFPLDTIKTRNMAKHKTLDIARFGANNVKELTPYLGFFKGYLSIIIGNMCFLTMGSYHFVTGVGA